MAKIACLSLLIHKGVLSVTFQSLTTVDPTYKRDIFPKVFRFIQQAYDLILKHRPQILPTTKYLRQLTEFDAKLYGEESMPENMYPKSLEDIVQAFREEKSKE